MTKTDDTDQTTTADDDGLDPREAARLLAETRLAAERQFEVRRPLSAAVGGVVILLGYGALWLSVRGQHPYAGPSLATIGLVYGVVAVSIAVSARAYRRATAGVRGPARRQQAVEGVAILISYLGSPVLQGALKHYGAGPALVYGVIPAAMPLIIVGTTVLGIAASHADWPQFGADVVVVTGGIVAVFMGPIGAWLTAGIGLSVAVLGYGLVTAWLRRRPALAG